MKNKCTRIGTLDVFNRNVFLRDWVFSNIPDGGGECVITTYCGEMRDGDEICGHSLEELVELAKHGPTPLEPDHCTCQPFKDAQESGTDNEGYGSAVWLYSKEWILSMRFKPITFCPWCGKRLPAGTEPSPVVVDIGVTEPQRVCNHSADDGSSTFTPVNNDTQRWFRCVRCGIETARFKI